MTDAERKTMRQEIAAARRQLSHRQLSLKARIARLERILNRPQNQPKGQL
jgi:hypothetical protein